MKPLREQELLFVARQKCTERASLQTVAKRLSTLLTLLRLKITIVLGCHHQTNYLDHYVK